MEPIKKITNSYEMLSINGIACNLGFGSYGSVQLAKSLTNGETVAVKKIHRKIAVNEVKMHYQLSHPHIIKMIDFFFDEETTTSYLVLEYAQNGTLFDFIKENGIKEKKQARSIFKSIC